MLRISKATHLKPGEIIERAAGFFGQGGEGLEETARADCCISFAGAGGYVSVTVIDDGASRSADVETREFEYQAKRFLERL
jgi:hypothetical protein